jgi:hypothetical protein
MLRMWQHHDCFRAMPQALRFTLRMLHARAACRRRLQNALLVRRLELERQLLEGLQTRVLHPAVVDYTLKRFEDELLQAVAERSQGDADLRRQASALERGVANQLRGLSNGYSESIQPRTKSFNSIPHRGRGITAALSSLGQGPTDRLTPPLLR